MDNVPTSWPHLLRVRTYQMTKRFRVTAWAYTTTVILVTVVVMQTYGLWNQRVGAFQERAERRAVVDSLLVVELLQHTDSIVAAIALPTTFLLLYQRDSIIRARRAECGPLRERC